MSADIQEHINELGRRRRAWEDDRRAAARRAEDRPAEGFLRLIGPFVLIVVWALSMAAAYEHGFIQARSEPCGTDTECAQLCGGNGDPEPLIVRAAP